VGSQRAKGMVDCARRFTTVPEGAQQGSHKSALHLFLLLQDESSLCTKLETPIILVQSTLGRNQRFFPALGNVCL
jgi:hypothetical protein